MYASSPESLGLISRLRAMLGGGGGDPTASLLGSSQNVDTSLAGLLNSKASSPTSKGVNPLSPPLSTISALMQNPNAPADPSQLQQPMDPLQQFLNAMAGDLSGSGSGLNQKDYEEALKNSAAQIKGAFGAEIGAVKASSANARHATKRSKKQIKAMYNALGRQYDKGAANEVAQGKDIANALQGVATTASGQLKGTSDQLLNEQAALAQNLGVQSALPDVAAAQQADVAKQVGNIQQYGARQAGDQLANSGSQQRYLVRGGKNALLEGTNRRADLVQQLQAFLQENMGKIADIKGQEGQALAGAQASVAKSFGDANANASNEKWNREKDLAQLMLSLKGQQSKGSSSGTSSLLPKWAQQSSQLLGSTSNPDLIGKTIDSIMGSSPVTTGLYGTGKGGNTPTKMTSAAFVDMVVKKLKAAGVSDADIPAAKLAALAEYQAYN